MHNTNLQKLTTRSGVNYSAMVMVNASSIKMLAKFY